MFFSYSEIAEQYIPIETSEKPDVYIMISRKLAKSFGVDPNALVPLPDDADKEKVFLATLRDTDDFYEKEIIVNEISFPIPLSIQAFPDKQSPEEIGMLILFQEEESLLANRYAEHWKNLADGVTYAYYEAPRDMVRYLLTAQKFEEYLATVLITHASKIEENGYLNDFNELVLMLHTAIQHGEMTFEIAVYEFDQRVSNFLSAT